MEKLIQKLESQIRSFLVHRGIEPVKLKDGYSWIETNGEVRVKVIDSKTIIISCYEIVNETQRFKDGPIKVQHPQEATFVVLQEREEPIIISHEDVHDFSLTLQPLIDKLKEELNSYNNI